MLVGRSVAKGFGHMKTNPRWCIGYNEDMFIRLTDDEVAIDEVFGNFFTSECGPETVRAAAKLGFEPALWDRLGQTGAAAMSAPETVGGGGADLGTLALAVGHLGRTIAPLPLIEHAVATRLLATIAPDHALLSGLIEGTAIATLALESDNAQQLVPAGAVADVVLWRSGGDIGIGTGAAPGAALHNMADLPLNRRGLDELCKETLSSDGSLFDRAIAEWQALMATALVGVGFGALQLGVDYVQERYQFDKLIGTFQSLQHGLADASTGLEGADLLAKRAIWALDANQPNALTLASMAMIFAAESALASAATSLQYHGGYGFAEEYDIQLYYRRAKGWPLQYGAVGPELQRLADQLIPSGKAAS